MENYLFGYLSFMTSPRNNTMLPISKPTAMKLRFSWTAKQVTWKMKKSSSKRIHTKRKQWMKFIKFNSLNKIFNVASTKLKIVKIMITIEWIKKAVFYGRESSKFQRNKSCSMYKLKSLASQTLPARLPGMARTILEHVGFPICAVKKETHQSLKLHFIE